MIGRIMLSPGEAFALRADAIIQHAIRFEDFDPTQPRLVKVFRTVENWDH